MSDQPLMSCTAVMHEDDGNCCVVAPATPKRRKVCHRDLGVETPSPSKKRRERAKRTRFTMWEKTRWSRHVDGLLADILAEGPAGCVVLQSGAQPGEGDRPCDDSTAEDELGKEEDIEDEMLLGGDGTDVAKYMKSETQLESVFVETGAALDDIREKLVAARLSDGWRFLAGEARVEAMKYSKEAMWALERSVMYFLRIWSVGEDDDERAAASRQIAMTLDDHMDEKEDEENSEETEAAQRDTVTVTLSEIMLWCTETYLWAMTDQFGTKMRAYAALRNELEGREFR